MYLDLSKPLSYNASLNFIILKRGYGKSYGFKMRMINNFLKGKGRFIWARRTWQELKDCTSKFTADIEHLYPNKKLTVNGTRFFIDNELAGYFVCLSKVLGKKSVSFNDVAELVYDEVIPEGGYQGYMPNEPQILASFLVSVFRDRQVRAFLLGNLGSTVTPYNIYYNIPPFNGNVYLPERKILIYTSDRNDEVEQNYQDSDISKILKGTAYYDYAFLNKSLNDDNEYITKLPKGCEQIFIINVSGKDLFFFADWKQGRIIIDTKGNTAFARKLCFDPLNLKESYFLYTRTCVEAKFLREHIRNGRLFYTSFEAKLIAQPMVLTLK